MSIYRYIIITIIKYNIYIYIIIRILIISIVVLILDTMLNSRIGDGLNDTVS